MTAKKTSSKGKAVKPDDKPTDQEQKTIDSYRKKQEKSGELPRLLVEGEVEPFGLTPYEPHACKGRGEQG